MRCGHSHEDGVYVLGALPPNERLDFERHLRGCDDCARAVRELAGLPGLLGRVDADLLASARGDEPVPRTLLPSLSREVTRAGRRHALAFAGLGAGLGAAAAAVVTGVVLSFTGAGDRSAHPVAAPTTTTAPAAPAAVSRPMTPVGDVPVRASVTLEPVMWGTRLALECTYDPGTVEYELPPEVDYLLVVRTRDGQSEQVGSWRSAGGTTMQLAAATASDAAEIASVEVQTPDGRVVLQLAS